MLRSSRTPLSLIDKDQSSVHRNWSCHQTAALFSFWAMDGFRANSGLGVPAAGCTEALPPSSFRGAQIETGNCVAIISSNSLIVSHCIHMSWVETWWQILTNWVLQCPSQTWFPEAAFACGVKTSTLKHEESMSILCLRNCLLLQPWQLDVRYCFCISALIPGQGPTPRVCRNQR